MASGTPTRFRLFYSAPRMRMLCCGLSVVLVVAALLCLVQARIGFPFQTTVSISPNDIRPAGGEAYAVSGPLRRYLEKELHPRLHLLEGRTPVHIREASSQTVRESNTAAFALSNRQLWFRTTDGSDPRKNGKSYAAVFPAVPAFWHVILSQTFLGLGLGFGVLHLCSRALPVFIARYGSLKAVVERGIVALICGVFFIPALLALFIKSGTTIFDESPWLKNSTLKGVIVQSEPVALSPRTLLSAEWQKNLATRWDTTFPGREAFIRLTSEGWYRAFGQVALRSTGVIVGIEGNLFEQRYLTEYHLTRTTAGALKPFVSDLKRLQDICASQGHAFVFLITPSKAAIQSETLPLEWLSRHDPRPRAYEQLLPLLREYGIHFVDGHALTQESIKHAPAPAFPRGGIHWNGRAALRTTNAMLAVLQKQGLPLQALTVQAEAVSEVPFDEEQDLLDLMNLAVPWRYPVVRVVIGRTPDTGGRLLNASYVGGSFGKKITTQLQSSCQFQEINSWFYYRLHKTCFGEYGTETVAEPVSQVDFNREFFAADCLILEANEQTLGTEGPNHLRVFLREAFMHVDSGLLKTEPYRQETAVAVAWGETISLGEESKLYNDHPLSQRGFSPTNDGTAKLTKGRALLNVILPKEKVDVVMRVSAKFVRSEENSAPIKVVVRANGHLVDAVPSSTSSSHLATLEFRIRREILDARPVCQLEFFIEPSAALSPDLRIRDLRFEPAP